MCCRSVRAEHCVCCRLYAHAHTRGHRPHPQTPYKTPHKQAASPPHPVTTGVRESACACVCVYVRACVCACVSVDVCMCVHRCSRNSVEEKSVLDCRCILRNFSQTRGQQPQHMCTCVCVCNSAGVMMDGEIHSPPPPLAPHFLHTCARLPLLYNIIHQCKPPSLSLSPTHTPTTLSFTPSLTHTAPPAPQNKNSYSTCMCVCLCLSATWVVWCVWVACVCMMWCVEKEKEEEREGGTHRILTTQDHQRVVLAHACVVCAAVQHARHRVRVYSPN